MKIKKELDHVDKIDVEHAGTVAVAVAEGLVLVLWHSNAVPPTAPLILESNPACVF